MLLVTRDVDPGAHAINLTLHHFFIIVRVQRPTDDDSRTIK